MTRNDPTPSDAAVTDLRLQLREPDTTAIALDSEDTVSAAITLIDEARPTLLDGFPEDVNTGEDRNLRRAMRALRALATYAEDTHSEGEPLQSLVTDILADLMHLVHHLREDTDGQPTEIDFDWLVERARRHYSEELAGE